MTATTWTADNGDGTFTNPIFYEEFSDPDIIRVGEWFYMTGTTMHTMPGLPVLRSADLVNWELLTYAFERLDLGPNFRLDGGDIYGQGIWAPCLRYHDGRFIIFTNINSYNTQIFEASDPAGPWTRREMVHCLHDLSVLFDDDGKGYVVWGYRDVQIAQLTDDLTDLVPGSQQQIFGAESGVGEGAHLYKIDGKYFITSAWFKDSMRLVGARADNLYGPWEVNPSLSEWEDFGLGEGYRMRDGGLPFTATPPFELIPPNSRREGRVSLHQGGVVDTPGGEWWGWSMMDYNSLGRLTALSPVTWQDGWPYFGLPGNLGRTPRSWVKPVVDKDQPPTAWLERSDGFDGPALKPIWQWNHLPDDTQWSLGECEGQLRLRTLPAASFFDARNTLTQRAVGPRSSVTVTLDGAGLEPGDVAGLALLGLPYRTLGLKRAGPGWQISLFDQQSGATVVVDVATPVVHLRVDCDFLLETAQFHYSLDGVSFEPLGDVLVMVFQLKTFQGMRYGLFAFNEDGRAGGHADFDDFAVHEPNLRGLFRPIPHGQTIVLSSGWHDLGPVEVVALGQGRVALRDAAGLWSVAEDGTVGRSASASAGVAESFHWMETVRGDLLLMSLLTNRFVCRHADGAVAADSPGATPDNGDGERLDWRWPPGASR